MYLLYLLNVVVLLSFSIGVSSSPVAQGSTSKCNARDIAIVKRTANESTYFCTWWNSDTRTRTPFMELTVSQINSACKCISKPSKNKRAATVDHPVLSKGQSVQSCSVEMSKQFTEPWHFCNFYTAYPRTTSPFRKYSAKSLLALCDCVEGKSISSTTKKSSTKKTSATKATTKTSSTKSSSSKKPTSSSSKKTSSSSKKSSLSSSSSKRLASSSSHKATSSSARGTKTSSTTKPISTSKSSTSSVHKTTSSSTMVSSTRKTSSSTKAKTSSSASRSSSSRLSTSTSIKPSSSTKSSSKILSSSQSSVHKTTGSKFSSGLSSSSTSSTRVTTTSSSKFSTTTTSSAIATKGPTVRTDGQFYLRVANTTSPPNDYYVSLGEGYALGPSRQLMFKIDSNGYLYESDSQGDRWVDIVGAFGIGNSGAFGQYDAGNLRCSYDENYLLSCTISSINGTSTQVIFEYKQYGSYFQLRGLSEPDGLPTINLYVELAGSSTPSTTSSSSSFASPTPSTSTSSKSATGTPTARTDGQFYIRVADAEAPPSDYYVFEGEVYTVASSRHTLFSIDSNGYLYQSSINGYIDQYVVIYDNGHISNYGAFGQYHPGNPRCSYDENYLLSCATTSSDGTLLPVTFSYDAYRQWIGLYAPSGLAAMDFYVEFAEISTPSTTSSSSSTTPLITLSAAVNTASPTPYFSTASSLNVSSTVSPIVLSTGSPITAYNVSSNASTTAEAIASPTVTPVCTLTPRLPNGGFEHGTNQTAWTGTGSLVSSWAPTTNKPHSGDLSAQFTFRASLNNTQTSARVALRNTLSDLCPGSLYSISYSSFCDVSREECFVEIWTSGSYPDQEYYSRTSLDSDWERHENAYMFTAASSTTTLYVYVGTMIDSRDVGNIYLDDFSIALWESQDIQDRVQKKVSL